jgi:hypothetical protein
VDLYRAHRTSDTVPSAAPATGDVCLDRYPRDLRRALTLAEAGQVGEGHSVLLQGLLDARAQAHEPLQRVYEEALQVYESRYQVAGN